ncbi:hypothetical protein QUF63_10925 [Anaerolineales bacterium HSG25]|nr:hypothetical protein [Anaerolineales bacterium HSG25]
MTIMPQSRTIKQLSTALFILMLVAGAVGVVTVSPDEVDPTDLVAIMAQSQPNPHQERATQAPPVATPSHDDEGDYVTYLHLTKPEDAVNILGHGIQPTEGIRSRRGDMRFYTITQERGPHPRPDNEDVSFMHSDLATQFQEEDSIIAILTLIEIKIPVNVVESLEVQQLIRYQGFHKDSNGFPVSPPPDTEAVFEAKSFSIINQYLPLWTSRPMRLK